MSSTLSPSTSRQAKSSVWLPISAFIGTSLALAIPLFMLHRQRVGRSSLWLSLNNLKSPPPPRRTSSTLTPLRSTTTHAFLSTSKQAAPEPSDFSSPGIRELISAISQMNQSTALLAAKAFIVATGLVAVGGVTVTWAVKTTLGVEDGREFGQKMRFIFQTTVPGLRSRLYRLPETDNERYEIQEVASSSSAEQDWNWEEAEERLKRAYEEGGITSWAQTALRELEAEVGVERSKRDGKQESASESWEKEPSPD